MIPSCDWERQPREAIGLGPTLLSSRWSSSCRLSSTWDLALQIPGRKKQHGPTFIPAERPLRTTPGRLDSNHPPPDSPSLPASQTAPPLLCPEIESDGLLLGARL